MNAGLLAASILTVLLAIAHTVIGELLIFRAIRRAARENPDAIAVLAPRRWAALWSSWHLVTLLGLGLAAVLWVLANNASASFAELRPVLTATFAISSVFWVWGTRGRHPAWLALAVIAAVIWSA